MTGRRTPIRFHDNICIKLESLNPSGSHKARAARHIVQSAIRSGDLKPHGDRRILEKTGGNLGLGLAFEAAQYGIGVDLVIGRSFSRSKKALCEFYGARLVGSDLLAQGYEPGEVIDSLLSSPQSDYFYTNQFENKSNLHAHLTETGPEITRQILSRFSRNKPIILVKGAGTGASFTGIAYALANAFRRVETVLVEPSGCDARSDTFITHGLHGISVGRRPPFLDWDLVASRQWVTAADARRGQTMLAREVGQFAGLSSGANYAVSKTVAEQNPDALIVTVAYDHGDPSDLPWSQDSGAPDAAVSGDRSGSDHDGIARP